MPHITAERLAALTDDPASPFELEHLGACPACCRERDEYHRLLAMASN